jgi:formate hydrogenlyase subunit 4
MSPDQLLGLVLQPVALILLAPLLQGYIKRLKAALQGRQGPGLLQPYADLAKLLRKGAIVPDASSWIFLAAPVITLSATITAALLVPTVLPGNPLGVGDILVVAGLLALARFAMALASLDTGSAFAGMGASREMAIAALVEPALVIAVLALGATAGTMDLGGISASGVRAGWLALGPAHLLAGAALLVVAIAETGRLPVDNPDTHLELTMVHEGMLLEYSGRPLAALTLAAQVKQVVVMSLVVALVLPWGIGSPLPIAIGAFLVKLFGLGTLLACIESAYAKLRILRLPDLMATAFALGGLSLVAHSVFGG